MWVETVIDPPPSDVPVVVRGVGLRIHGFVEAAVVVEGIVELPASIVPDTRYEMTGRVSNLRDFYATVGPARIGRAGAEFVLSVGDDKFQVMVNGSSVSEVESLGGSVTVTGRLRTVGDYEWDDDEFGLEDNRADWLITAVDGWMQNMQRQV